MKYLFVLKEIMQHSHFTCVLNLRKDTLVDISVDDIVQEDLEVMCSDGLQVMYAAVATVLTVDSEPFERSDCGVHTGTVHGVTDGTGVGEVRQLHTPFDVVLEDRVRVLVDVVLQLVCHDGSDLDEFIGAVVGEVDVVTDTRHHSRNVREEFVHTVLVPGKSDDEVVLLVLHDVQQNLDRFLSVVTVISCVVQIVCLIDQKHSTHSLLDHLLRLGSCVTDVLSNKVITGRKNYMALTGVSHLGKDLSHPDGDSRLTCSWRTGEAHVQRRDGGLETKLTTHLIQNKKGSNFLHTLLDRDQTDQFLIELI
mmetsp:Transcript_62682/g.152586  ORF Transcript_62682/g.152586 Transcript_62682/m.152586 type:complete len:308 (-) Transcript_62682:420-1343(-)